MNNEKKGFTLVELLAVIVILAIILVIAVPKIMEVINDAKKATLESTVKMIASAAEKAKVQNTVLGNDGEINCKSITNINDVDYESCTIIFEDSEAIVTIKGKGKFAGLNVCNGTKTVATSTDDECSSSSNNPYALSSLATTSELVTGINACVSKGKICTNGANGTEPTMFAIKVNETEVYDFYVIFDNGNEITLLMNENLVENVAWGDYNTEGDNLATISGPDIALESLKTSTSGWQNIPEREYAITDNMNIATPNYSIEETMRARLITRDEAFNTLECTDKNGTTVATAISGCPSYMYNGVKTDANGNVKGYWTSDYSINYKFSSSYNNYMESYIGYYETCSETNSCAGGIGIRPVITLEK